MSARKPKKAAGRAAAKRATAGRNRPPAVESAREWIAWRALVAKLQHAASAASRDFAATLASLQPTDLRVPVAVRAPARRRRP